VAILVDIDLRIVAMTPPNRTWWTLMAQPGVPVGGTTGRCLVVSRLKDVAAAAGVSVKTVSNVVNGYPGVTRELRLRVEQAVAELDYRPNLNARSLRTGRTGLIGMVVPRLDEPYFAELARWVVTAAGERGWTVLVDQTEGDPAREAFVVGTNRPRLLDGVILSPLALDDDALHRRDPAVPLVLLGERVSPASGADHVAIDNHGAAKVATQHLVESGRRAIGVIGSQRDQRWTTPRVRLQGFRAAMSDADIAVREQLIGEVEIFHRADGAAAVRAMFEAGERPDALFCFNDLLAHGAIRALADLGVRVPDDVAVVGFDDNEQSSFSVPTVTSIAPNKQRLAQLAVAALAERLEAGEPPPPREISAPFELRVRESSTVRRTAG
jgi:DNA-binding LacI/PurR family transcriptional regulator